MDEQEIIKERFKVAVTSAIKAISGNFDLEIKFGNQTESKKNSLNLPEIISLKKMQDFINFMKMYRHITFCTMALYQKISKTITELLDESSYKDYMIEVEGHTDDTDIASPKYPSNWELSTARAASIVRLLVKQGVEPGRLIAAGFGSTRPIKNILGLTGRSLKKAREKNRRVEIFLSTLKGKSLKSY